MTNIRILASVGRWVGVCDHTTELREVCFGWIISFFSSKQRDLLRDRLVRLIPPGVCTRSLLLAISLNVYQRGEKKQGKKPQQKCSRDTSVKM
jgi:hypothetical protein